MSETTHQFKDFVCDWTRGRTLPLNLKVTRTETDPETEETVTGPEDLSAGEVWVTGKLSLAHDDAEALFRLNTAGLGGVSVVDAAAGKARALITAAMSRELPNKTTLVYVDCVRVSSDGESYSFQQGIITFRPSGEETLT